MKPTVLNLKNNFCIRLITVFIVVTLGSSLVLNYFFFKRASQKLKADLFNHGQSMTRMLADMSRLGVFIGSRQELEGPASTVYQEPHCKKVVIYDMNGTALLALGSETNTNKETISRPNLFKMVSGSYQEPFVYDSQQSSEVIFGRAIFSGQNLNEEDIFLSPLLAEANFHTDPSQKPIGYVTIVLSSKAMEEEARIFMLRNIAATLLIVLASSLCIFVIVSRMTLPLQSLAREITKHKAQLPDTRDSCLSDDFTEMIGIIRESYSNIVGLKENLEDKVRIRTEELTLSNAELARQKSFLEKANTELSNTLHKLECTQEQLIQSEKMAALGHLVAGLSHEVNNALNFITGALPLLERNFKKPEDVEDTDRGEQENEQWSKRNQTLIGNIREGTRRITELTRNLRVFSYNNPRDFIKDDIHTGLAASISIAKSKYGKEIEFREEFAEGLPRVSCNIGQLNQVFLNLLLNAAQAIHGPGRITVRTYYEEGMVRVAFSDTGEGIPRERLSRIFDPFFTTKGVGEGTGLGLSISYSIITRHGGKIRASSTLGQGSTFEITLPIDGPPGMDVGAQ